MSEKSIVKTYQNDDLIVEWEPKLCIHSTNCWKGLLQVFNPQQRPWVNLDAASAERITEQIDKCPSGALRYLQNKQATNMETSNENNAVRVEVIPNGPLAVHSSCAVSHPNGTIEQKASKAFFCRCGASSNKPYCDGSHKKIEFEG